MNRTSDEQIATKVATTTTMENKITFPEETTSSYHQGIQEFFNQLAHESTTLAQPMTSPEETATRSNEFLEELFHQFSDEKTSTTSSFFEAETLPTRSPVLPQPEQDETTTIDPLTLKYYYLYKTLQAVEVEEKKDEYQLVLILYHFISYIIIIDS